MVSSDVAAEWGAFGERALPAEILVDPKGIQRTARDARLGAPRLGQDPTTFRRHAKRRRSRVAVHDTTGDEGSPSRARPLTRRRELSCCALERGGQASVSSACIRSGISRHARRVLTAGQRRWRQFQMTCRIRARRHETHEPSAITRRITAVGMEERFGLSFSIFEGMQFDNIRSTSPDGSRISARRLDACRRVLGEKRAAALGSRWIENKQGRWQHRAESWRRARPTATRCHGAPSFARRRILQQLGWDHVRTSCVSMVATVPIISSSSRWGLQRTR